MPVRFSSVFVKKIEESMEECLQEVLEIFFLRIYIVCFSKLPETIPGNKNKKNTLNPGENRNDLCKFQTKFEKKTIN